MTGTHTIHAKHHHFGWDNSFLPVITVAPGDSMEIDTVDSSGGQLTVNSRVGDVSVLDFEKVNPVTGPIRVDGADPGDILKVTIDHFAPSGWGWTTVIPRFGLLADQFTEPGYTPGAMIRMLCHLLPMGRVAVFR